MEPTQAVRRRGALAYHRGIPVATWRIALARGRTANPERRPH
jgi:hypothetical protein